MIGPRGKRENRFGDVDSPETFFDLTAEEVCENPPPFDLTKPENLKILQESVPLSLRVRSDYAAWRDGRLTDQKVLGRNQRARVADLILSDPDVATPSQGETGRPEVAAAKAVLGLKGNARAW